MKILTTLVPIFIIITVGFLARKKGFMPNEFLGPANRLIYYLAIPAMIFHSIATSSFTSYFNFSVIAVTLSSIMIICAATWAASLILCIEARQVGTFIQSSFHGNLGYIGLAVSYYYLGDKGFVSASIIAGFTIILQNILAVFVLIYTDKDKSRIPLHTVRHKLRPFLKVMKNPIIISAVAGIIFSWTGIQLPVIMGRSLDILSGMALPTSLLIIGASLSFDLVKFKIKSVMISSIIKLLILPCTGFILYRLFHITPQEYAPGLILLASPTATLTYVMAKEMNGDADFSVAAISASTLLSGVTFFLWLNLTG